MWFTRTADGFRAWLRVETSTGILRTGLAASAFTITVRNPQDTASISPNPAVTQSAGKPGLYRFDVPSAFLVTHGVGEYAVLVEVSATAPTLRATAVTALGVSLEDWDSLVQAGSLIATTATATSNVRKTLENREEIDFTAQELRSYEDDGLTLRRRWPLETNAAEPVTTSTGVQTKRKKSVI